MGADMCLPQLGIAGWGPVSEVKDFPKTNQDVIEHR